jgi:NAD(P)H-hydrate epimerase
MVKISEKGSDDMVVRELDHSAVLNILPDRNPWGHKGSFGKILLLCGSRGFTGAAYLAAMGALRSGAGLTFLGVPESIYAIEAIKLNEPVVFPLPEENGRLHRDGILEIEKRLPQMDAVLMGCGLGQSDDVREVVHFVLENARCPVVLDADGINVLAQHKDILRGRKGVTILTPHVGEFQRLTGTVISDRVEDAKALSSQMGCIMVLKGHNTVITDGATTYINPTGNPGMAVGGSGDVLAGIIVSLLGQGLEPLEAAAAGTWLHGAAGDRCASEFGQYGMLPSDMIQQLPRLMK